MIQVIRTADIPVHMQLWPIFAEVPKNKWHTTLSPLMTASIDWVLRGRGVQSAIGQFTSNICDGTKPPLHIDSNSALSTASSIPALNAKAPPLFFTQYPTTDDIIWQQDGEFHSRWCYGQQRQGELQILVLQSQCLLCLISSVQTYLIHFAMPQPSSFLRLHSNHWQHHDHLLLRRWQHHLPAVRRHKNRMMMNPVKCQTHNPLNQVQSNLIWTHSPSRSYISYTQSVCKLFEPFTTPGGERTSRCWPSWPGHLSSRNT